ncbi:MAG: Flp family type IVb pilin [Roseiarcus sp.]
MRYMIERLATQVGVNSESGVTAIEYGLLAALIAVAIIASVTLVGTNLAAVFTAISGHLTSAI